TQEKKTVSFSCKVNRLNATVKWMKAGQEITLDKRIVYRVDKDKHTLTIKNCTVADEGEYAAFAGDDKSTAENVTVVVPFCENCIIHTADSAPVYSMNSCRAVAKTFGLVSLVVTFILSFQFIALISVPYIAISPPAVPKIKTMDQSYVTDAGKPIVMAVPYSAYPKAEADWLYNNLSLPADNVHTSLDCTEYRLKDPKKSDEGRYKIIIKNKHGEGEAFINLEVIGDTNVQPLVLFSVNQHGTSLTLGIPVPTAKWSIEGEEITSEGNVKIDTDNFSTVLSINECTRNHTGSYLLTVSNPAGTKTVAMNVTVLDVPAAPIGPVNILEVTPDSMLIEWRPPKDDGGSPVTNYIVEKRESNKETWGGVSSGSTATKLKISRLQKGVEYVVRIRAENKMGIGAPLESKPTVAQHSFLPPSQPGKPQTSDITEDAVTVGWTMPLSDGGSQITGYLIERRHKGGKWIRVNKTPCKDLRYRVMGLFEGNDYEFRVFAENIAGFSGPSPISDPCKPCRPITVPSPPVNPKVKDYSKITADLVWTKPTRDGGSPILGYTVEMKRADTEEWKKVNLDDFIKQCAFRVKGLEEGVEYRFRVRATNMIGDGEPREVPESITISGIGADKCRVVWDPPEDDGGCEVDSYILEKCETRRMVWSTYSASVVTSYCNVTRLVEGNEYIFRVRAENKMGTGPPMESKPVTVRTQFNKPGPPEAPEVTKVG
uniref:Titin n=1 Tax=Myripristis murdjan TaxID=586833 RepID=A0A667WUR0_9TELE